MFSPQNVCDIDVDTSHYVAGLMIAELDAFDRFKGWLEGPHVKQSLCALLVQRGEHISCFLRVNSATFAAPR